MFLEYEEIYARCTQDDQVESDVNEVSCYALCSTIIDRLMNETLMGKTDCGFDCESFVINFSWDIDIISKFTKLFTVIVMLYSKPSIYLYVMIRT